MKYRAASLLAIAVAAPAFAQPEAAGTATAANDIVVTSGYQAEPASLPLPTTVLKTPRSIQLVDADEWERRNVTHPNEALRLTSGFAQSGTYGGFRPSFSLRGFGVNRILDDGFNVIGTSGARTSELAAFSRIEALKGPSGAEYGNISSGGIINFVSRLPGQTAAVNLTGQLDSNGQRRGVVDYNVGEVGGGVALRAVGAYENSDSYRDFVDRELIFIAPSLLWQASDRTRVNIVVRHQKATGVFDQMLPNSPLVLALPRGRFFGEKTDRADFRTTLARAWLEHKLADNVSFRIGANRSRTKYTNSFWSPRGNVNTVQRSFTQAAVVEKNTIDETILQANLRGSFNFVSNVRSDLLLAVEGQKEKVRPMSQSAATLTTNRLDAPVYGRAFPAIADVFRTEKQKWLAITLQQQHTWNDVLTLNQGVRIDFSKVTRLDEAINLYRELKSTNASPFVGLSYRPAPWLSLYANYATSFTNQIGNQLLNNGVPDPLKGKQFEGGVKVASRDGHVTGTASVFEITQRNVLTASQTPGVSIQTGEVRTRGFELEATAEIVKRVFAQLAYTYLNSEVTKDTTIAPGTRLTTDSKHNFNLWTEYALPITDGLRLGGGLFYVGKRTTANTGGFVLPAYTRLDGSLSYERGGWRATAYLENITNKKYWYTRGPVISPQAPLTASLRIAKTF